MAKALTFDAEAIFFSMRAAGGWMLQKYQGRWPVTDDKF